MSAPIDTMCENNETLTGKKRRLESGVPSDTGTDETFSGFSVDKILREDTRHKVITLQGKFEGSEDKAVLLLEKRPFDRDSVNKLLSTVTRTKQTLKNDIYSTFDTVPDPAFAGFKTTMIYPATEKHIMKYSDQEVWVVRETPELYNSVTLPSIEASNFSIQWVYNILEKKTEADRIVFEDSDPENGFLLLPDMKWDRKDLDSLYLVAIANRRRMKSLRDLDESSLPLLRNILKKGKLAIKDKYGIPESKLRIYVHYQPSYYHFHVHFTHVKLDPPGSGVLHAHLLDDIIDNIEHDGQCYKKKTMCFTVRENDDLKKHYAEAGYFK
ncbi:m7GpppX diphosphatase-like [Gigantopelta aegis]|uniref:m7GpppX diphosphatase-like n=1 Tax=Gigantopelta aegis TaxID=1735272 RepID=UPI001B88D30E|nr:m7GpppX diphosphatase-like [Gigantopelta aegis]